MAGLCSFSNRAVFCYLKESKRHCEPTADAAARALHSSRNIPAFGTSDCSTLKQAIAFKRHLSQQKGREPGERFFHNGAIEVDLAGSPAAGAASAARGFIGIAFRLQNGQYEYIYLRPTNGRADDQVRRNHSTQYSSHPNFSFADARQQAPEKYESYVDLESGVWTRYRIVVERTKARLYVNGASQPCLIVNDLKLSDSSGGAALWIGPGTEGYFASLKVEAAK